MKRIANKPENTPVPLAASDAQHRIGPLLGWTFPGLVLLVMLANSMTAIAGEKKSQSQLDVSATVLTMIKVRVMSQPNQITIEQKHVSQGYIDIVDASVLQITSNSPDGFMMLVSCDPVLVSRVSARLSPGGGAMDGENMISVRTQHVKDEPMRVSYRLHLNPEALAGNVPWPVALSFTPRAV